MFIIPYIHTRKTLPHTIVNLFTILTIGGNDMWEEDHNLDIETDILHPNGIYLKTPPIIHDKIVLCNVDASKTDINDFYKWDEIDKDDNTTFCWKTIYTFNGNTEDTKWWLPIPKEEKLGPYTYNELCRLMSNEVI